MSLSYGTGASIIIFSLTVWFNKHCLWLWCIRKSENHTLLETLTHTLLIISGLNDDNSKLLKQFKLTRWFWSMSGMGPPTGVNWWVLIFCKEQLEKDHHWVFQLTLPSALPHFGFIRQSIAKFSLLKVPKKQWQRSLKWPHGTNYCSLLDPLVSRWEL